MISYFRARIDFLVLIYVACRAIQLHGDVVGFNYFKNTTAW